MHAAVVCRGLVKRYGALAAVDGLELEVRAGECFGLLGPNGAGKTTTLEILEGLRTADAGEVEVLGQRWGAGQDRALRVRLGVQLQETQLPEKLTVLETVRLFRSFYPSGQPPEAVVAEVGLTAKLRDRVGRLSGGQRQRLALACALVGTPELLFLDEPTTGLDPQGRRAVWQTVEAFRSGGGTVLLTTHYMEEAARLCDRLAIVDQGRVIAHGSPAELVASLEADEIVELELAGQVDHEPLHAIEGVTGIDEHHGALRLRVRSLAATLPPLLAELERQRVAVRTLGTHRTTLEDVFVHLTGRGLRDG